MPAAAVGTTRAPAVGVESTRVSNGLRELMWNLDGLGRGTLLDMGGAWQATLSFFIEKGFRVTTDDLLRTWKQFLENEDKEFRERSKADQSLDLTPAARANRFFESNIQYPMSSFDVVLLWDLLGFRLLALTKNFGGQQIRGTPEQQAANKRKQNADADCVA